MEFFLDSYNKQCKNGTWDAADYSQCFKTNRLQSNMLIHIVILAASVVAILPVLITIAAKQKLFKKSHRVIFMLILIFGVRNILAVASKILVSLLMSEIFMFHYLFVFL